MSIPLDKVHEEILELRKQHATISAALNGLQRRLDDAGYNCGDFFCELTDKFMARPAAALLLEQLKALGCFPHLFQGLTYERRFLENNVTLSFAHYSDFADESQNFHFRPFPVDWIDLHTDDFSITDIDLSYFEDDYKTFVSYLEGLVRRLTPKNKSSSPKKAIFPSKIEVAYKEKQVTPFRNFEVSE